MGIRDGKGMRGLGWWVLGRWLDWIGRVVPYGWEVLVVYRSLKAGLASARY